MKIPKEAAQRQDFFADIERRCEATRATRRSVYASLKSYYYYGADGGSRALDNKIWSHVELLTSFTYAQESTRFSVDLTAEADPKEVGRLNAVSKWLNDQWYSTNADETAMQASLWSYVHGTEFIKLIARPEGNMDCYLLDPDNIGVLNENLTSADRQEAICHWYTVGNAEFERLIAPHPNRQAILDAIQPTTAERSEQEPPQLIQNIVLSQTTPNLIGHANLPQTIVDYTPNIAEDVVKMCEMWIWDDALGEPRDPEKPDGPKDGDYRIVTIAEPGVTIFDRKNFFVPDEHPFVKFTPLPLHSYFWGFAEVGLLLGLQDLREKRFGQISDLWDRQLKPPKALSGFSGITDEKLQALMQAGGMISTSFPGAKVDEFKPDMPDETFAELNQIDQMFAEIGGMGNVLQGRGEAGVRSRGHAAVLAQLSSSRIKKRALAIERGLDKLAFLMLALGRAKSTATLIDDKGQPFKLGQFTDKVKVRVDAHSSSPIFIDNQKEEAWELFKARAIDRATLIESIHPPREQILLQRLKAIEKAEAAAAEAEKQAELQKQSLKSK